MTKKQFSTCCHAPVKTVPEGPLKRGATYWYECLSCSQACNATTKDSNEVQSEVVDGWEKEIMSLSEMVGDEHINPVMSYPHNCHNDNFDHTHTDGYVCHHDCGFLCEHRAKWVVDFIRTLLAHREQEAYKKGVMDEIKCVENSGEHADLQNKIREEKHKAKRDLVERMEKILVNNTFGHDDKKLGTIIAVDFELALKDLRDLKKEVES